jgi:hypothetical protein
LLVSCRMEINHPSSICFLSASRSIRGFRLRNLEFSCVNIELVASSPSFLHFQ